MVDRGIAIILLSPIGYNLCLNVANYIGRMLCEYWGYKALAYPPIHGYVNWCPWIRKYNICYILCFSLTYIPLLLCKLYLCTYAKLYAYDYIVIYIVWLFLCLCFLYANKMIVLYCIIIWIKAKPQKVSESAFSLNIFNNLLSCCALTHLFNW